MSDRQILKVIRALVRELEDELWVDSAFMDLSVKPSPADFYTKLFWDARRAIAALKVRISPSPSVGSGKSPVSP